MGNLSRAFKEDMIENIPYCRARRHGAGSAEERKKRRETGEIEERPDRNTNEGFTDKIRVTARCAETTKRLGEMKVEIALFWWKNRQAQALVERPGELRAKKARERGRFATINASRRHRQTKVDFYSR
jgi:hypothetical protein